MKKKGLYSHYLHWADTNHLPLKLQIRGLVEGRKARLNSHTKWMPTGQLHDDEMCRTWIRLRYTTPVSINGLAGSISNLKAWNKDGQI